MKDYNKSFEEKYPHITHFVRERGIIQIGYDESFVFAYDDNGEVFKGEEDYDTIEEAFTDLEAGIKEYIEIYSNFCY